MERQLIVERDLRTGSVFKPVSMRIVTPWDVATVRDLTQACNDPAVAEDFRLRYTDPNPQSLSLIHI